ncbi:MAG: phosphatidate cytidylyltransferase [Tissierellia bacterium]|nr:phosphatidate cytidylyltransferase [Tissierellia bacterium]
MKDLGIRFFSALLGIILLIFIVNKGGLYLSISILLISLIGLWEFYNAMHKINLKPIRVIGYLATILFFISSLQYNIQLSFIFTLTIILSLITLLFNRDVDIQSIGVTLLGIIYIPFLLFHVKSLEGTKYIWLIFIIAFGTDTCAYFAGNMFGKKKLSPEISPNKTVEGSIGGIFGSVILTLIYSVLVDISLISEVIILTLFTSIIAQIGDLIASKIKRITGIKDYGNLIPGHGGILDRFDSIILTAPVVYYFVEYLFL